jgi:hypothetical protein
LSTTRWIASTPFSGAVAPTRSAHPHPATRRPTAEPVLRAPVPQSALVDVQLPGPTARSAPVSRTNPKRPLPEVLIELSSSFCHRPPHW